MASNADKQSKLTRILSIAETNDATFHGRRAIIQFVIVNVVTLALAANLFLTNYYLYTNTPLVILSFALLPALGIPMVQLMVNVQQHRNRYYTLKANTLTAQSIIQDEARIGETNDRN